ncbi:MAG: hypothetical protein K0R00_933 [Herbinix sp.]|nr:hypothetical protein [Herbinix sp.]
MTIDGALITEQGVTFAIAVVKSHVLSSSNREDVRNSFKTVFGNVPIILMSQDSRGIPTYHGKPDIVKFLASIHPSRIPFKRYTVS